LSTTSSLFALQRKAQAFALTNVLTSRYQNFTRTQATAAESTAVSSLAQSVATSHPHQGRTTLALGGVVYDFGLGYLCL